MNIFERAARKNLCFSTSKGVVSAAQLFDMPLTSRDAFNLDATAQNVAAEIESAAGKSFVSEEHNPAKANNELRLDILKHVIASKLLDKQAVETRAANVAKRSKLIDALAVKEGAELAGKSKDEILAELAELDS